MTIRAPARPWPALWYVLSALLITAVTLAGHYLVRQRLSAQVFGYADIPDLLVDLLRPSLMIAGTFLGILFSLLIKHLRQQAEGEAAPGSGLLSRQRLLLASFLSPLVISAVYLQLSAMQSLWLVFLISYQNGYFWESLIANLGPQSRTSK